jgi:peptidoglycan/xylan/chitin deacetylase (PgdA/CDA1 family)
MSARRRWQPSPLIRGSIWLHALAAIAASVVVIARPPHWPLALAGIAAAIIVDHLVLTAAGLWPRSTLLGPNRVHCRDCETARGRIVLTIDDGPEPQVTPRVLDLLAAHGAHATFFLIGTRAAAYPDLVRRIASEGHGIENHSYAHDHGFSLRGRRWLSADIDAAQRLLSSLAGRPPRFFRAPAGLRSPLLEPILARAGLGLASWTRRGFDTRTADPGRVLERLAGRDGRRLAAGDILLLHDGHGARDAAGEPVILAVLARLLSLCRERELAVVSLDTVLPR